MTPPFQRVTPDEVDWIIAQLKQKTKILQERLDFEGKVRKKELEKKLSENLRDSIVVKDNIKKSEVKDKKMNGGVDVKEEKIKDIYMVEKKEEK